jgi:hypothetical protein
MVKTEKGKVCIVLEVVYRSQPSSNSGARYHKVTTSEEKTVSNFGKNICVKDKSQYFNGHLVQWSCIDSRQAKVTNFDGQCIYIYQYILWFHVPMDNVTGMDVT